jgi:D-serine dehydratase
MSGVTSGASFAAGNFLLDETVKGIPGGVKPFPLSEIAERKWNVLREDLPLPLLVLKRSAIRNNVQVMKSFLERNRLSLCPHAKTHMSPQLIELQLSNGAWGITAGNISQVQVFRRFGVSRILLANQLVGRQNIRFVVEQLNADSSFDFFCLVDSVEGVKHLAGYARQFGLKRPMKVLLEGGYRGGRAGCRTIEQARAVLAELRNARPSLMLAGVEGFEGVISKDTPAESLDAVNQFLGFLKELFAELKPEDFSGVEEVILSAGGSAYFDVVAKAFEEVNIFLPKRVVLRSGCYITHDSRMYRESQEQMLTREWQGPQLQAAFEIWAYVQSLPEKGLAILTMGKRDAPYDYYLPTPLRRSRTGDKDVDLSSCQITRMNDQHAYMTFADGMDLRLGDRVISGISHPCTAFDKWRFIAVVNDEYDVVDGVITYF